MLRSMAYAVGHRTPSLHLDDHITVRCVDLPVDSFLPSVADWEDARAEMEHLVKKILVCRVPDLKLMSHLVPKHRNHIFAQVQKVSINISD